MDGHVSLSSAQRAKIRRLSAPRELSPDEEGGELNIVPFLDIIVNILIFVLATVAVTFTTTIESTPPATQGTGVRRDIESAALNLTVLIVEDGISLKASGGNVAAGCDGVGAGIAIPNRDGRYDFVGLNRCVAKLKGASPDFEDERQAFLSANPGVEYGTVVAVMDALRRDFTAPSRVLFDDIDFKVPR